MIVDLPTNSKSKTSTVGHAAEAFMIFRFSLWGYEVSTAPPGSHYDLICDINSNLLKIQVKGSSKAQPNSRRTSHSYKFDACKGRGRRIPYNKGDYDVLAMVALPERRCLFETHTTSQTSYSKHRRLFTKENELETWVRSLEKLIE